MTPLPQGRCPGGDRGCRVRGDDSWGSARTRGGGWSLPTTPSGCRGRSASGPSCSAGLCWLNSCQRPGLPPSPRMRTVSIIEIRALSICFFDTFHTGMRVPFSFFLSSFSCLLSRLGFTTLRGTRDFLNVREGRRFYVFGLITPSWSGFYGLALNTFLELSSIEIFSNIEWKLDWIQV